MKIIMNYLIKLGGCEKIEKKDREGDRPRFLLSLSLSRSNVTKKIEKSSHVLIQN